MGLGLLAVPSESTRAGFIDPPLVMAGEARVGLRSGLDASGLAGRAERASMKPVTIRIERIFDKVGIDSECILRSEHKGFVPGGTLHGEQLDVSFVLSVTKQCMSALVEQIGNSVRLVDSVRNSTSSMVPTEHLTLLESEMGETWLFGQVVSEFFC